MALTQRKTSPILCISFPQQLCNVWQKPVGRNTPEWKQESRTHHEVTVCLLCWICLFPSSLAIHICGKHYAVISFCVLTGGRSICVSDTSNKGRRREQFCCWGGGGGLIVSKHLFSLLVSTRVSSRVKAYPHRARIDLSTNWPNELTDQLTLVADQLADELPDKFSPFHTGSHMYTSGAKVGHLPHFLAGIFYPK